MEVGGHGVANPTGAGLARPFVGAEYWRVRDLEREKHDECSKHKSQRPHLANLARRQALPVTSMRAPVAARIVSRPEGGRRFAPRERERAKRAEATELVELNGIEPSTS
jgi:hypothetical protein